MKVSIVKSPRELEEWLQDKPDQWAQVIAARTAIRVFPCILNALDDWIERFGLGIIRATVLSWTTANFPAVKMGVAGLAASREVMEAARAADSTVSVALDATDRAAANYDDYHQTVNSAIVASTAALTVANAVEIMPPFMQHIGLAGQAFQNANSCFAAAFGTASEIDATNGDCSWLSAHRHETTPSRIISRRSLWLGKPPQSWLGGYHAMRSRLLYFDPNYSVWIDWYERRIRGERAAFDIPGDKGRVEDKKILRRLAEATDEDFWGKGHEYVNATLKGWLDEARQRVTPPPIIGGASGAFEITGSATAEVLDAITPDPQDTRSPQFGSDATGRIAIKPHAGTDQLRSDSQSVSRHSRALQMAQRLAEALRNHNNAGYITEMARDYIAAMESGQDGPDPSGLVFAGDQLRGAIAKHRAAGPDDDLQPLPPSADRDASAFLAAHNMYVGSDPFLDDLDRTTRGPDAPLPSANPDEIMGLVTAPRQADIVAEPTYDYMVAASAAAPSTYDSADRHSRFAAGLAQNFARYGTEFLWAYPNEAAWAGLAAGAVATVALGPLAAAGGTIAGIGIAYHMARNMIANEAIYEKLLATSPAGEDNFKRLMRFLKSLPIKSLRDD